MNSESSSERLIHNYLAGELSPEEEAELFERLSSDPALREELSLQRKMHESLQKDLGSVTIPAAVMAGVFSSVGFLPPKPTPDPQNAGSKLRRVALVSASRVYAIVAGTAAIAVISAAAYLILRPSTTAAPEMRPAEHSVTTVAEARSIEQGDRASTTELSSERRVASSKHRLTEAIDPSPVATPEGTRIIPNEPIKAYFDIGKFSSVDYLTQQKIVGVADAGKIYCSEDGGKSWVLQSSNTTKDLFGVNFFDTSRGIVVGADGTILHTRNAGRDWDHIQSPSGSNLITVRYATQDTVYACGAHGTVLRSTSGGADWHVLELRTPATLFKIVFVDGANGSVSGERGIRFDTHDAGVTWHKR